MIDNTQPALTAEQPNQHANDDPAAFLKLVGENIRRLRTDHGLTRKAFALQSGVSERFLAQLETGAGNASILVLRRSPKHCRYPPPHS